MIDSTMFVLTKVNDIRCYSNESRAQFYADIEDGFKHISTVNTFELVKHLYTASDKDARQAFKRIRDKSE